MPTCYPLLYIHLYGLIALFSAATVAEPPPHEVQPVPPTMLNLPASLQYDSAMKTYKTYTDQPVQSWQEANELVGNIGGWRTYLREAAAEADASETDAPSSHHEHHHGEVQP